MDLNRREFGTVAVVSLSGTLAGCADAEDDGGDDSESETEESDDVAGEEDVDSGSDGAGDGGSNESEPTESESDDGDDGEDDAAEQDSSEDDEETDSTESGEANESDAEDGDEEAVYEDDSIDGEVVLSAEADRHLEVQRHTFTWEGEPPSERCQVHAMLANASGAELTVSMTARVFDADGNERSSTTKAATEGPEPGADDAVYSFELNNCPETAAYELEITDVEAAGEPDGSDDEPERHLLRVLVQDGFGDPIEEATVRVEERGLGGWGDTRAVDEHGQAEFEFQPGDYRITVAAEGYPTLEDSLELTGNVEYSATLRADG